MDGWLGCGDGGGGDGGAWVLQPQPPSQGCQDRGTRVERNPGQVRLNELPDWRLGEDSSTTVADRHWSELLEPAHRAHQ